jgi:hypothetical protein
MINRNSSAWRAGLLNSTTPLGIDAKYILSSCWSRLRIRLDVAGARSSVLSSNPALARSRPCPAALTPAFLPPTAATIQFSFDRDQKLAFPVITSTVMSLPLAAARVVGAATHAGRVFFELTGLMPTNAGRRFHRAIVP